VNGIVTVLGDPGFAGLLGDTANSGGADSARGVVESPYNSEGAGLVPSGRGGRGVRGGEGVLRARAVAGEMEGRVGEVSGDMGGDVGGDKGESGGAGISGEVLELESDA
jgi:hypothetical protein